MAERQTGWNKRECFLIFPGLMDFCPLSVWPCSGLLETSESSRKWNYLHLWPRDHPITHWPSINSKKLLFYFLKVFFIQIWFYEINSGLLHVERVNTNKWKTHNGMFGRNNWLTLLFFKSWLWREATDKLNSKSKYFVNHQKRHIYVEKYQNLNVRSVIIHQGYSKWGPGTSAHLRQDKNRKCEFENFRAVDITTSHNLWFCIL